VSRLCGLVGRKSCFSAFTAASVPEAAGAEDTQAFPTGARWAETWPFCFVTPCSSFSVLLKADCNKGYVTVKQVCF